jgi:hypothetical protein
MKDCAHPVSGGGTVGWVFGRRNRDDEDPFAALKESGTYNSAPTSTLPGIPASSEQTPVPARPSRTPAPSSRPASRPARARRRRSRGGGAYLILLRVFIPLALVIAVVATVSTHSTISTPTFSTPGISPNNPTSGHHVITTTLRRASYLTATGLAAGLAQVRRLAPRSKVELLRIDSTSLAATINSGHGQAEEILLEPTGTLREPAGSPGLPGISLSQINPAVPPRLIKEMATKFHVPKSRINYIVAIAFQGLPPMWGVYLKNGANYQASLTGAGLHKNG